MSIQVNNKPIEYFNFSGGECHISIADINITDEVNITAYLYASDDVMRLLMVVNAIRQKQPMAQVNLTIPYFPYARQDRVCNEGEAFAIAVMARLINTLDCKSVTIYDPHSKVTEDLVNNCIAITQANILPDSIVSDVIKANKLVLVSPDLGATAKTRELSETLNVNAIYCTKTRNIKTGKIESTHIPTGVSGNNFIIIDDICDGGRTFIELAKALKEAGAKDLYLYVTHGIFSKGLNSLKPYFKHIYCYHSFLQSDAIDTQFLSIIKEK